jgi:hypothetical protein
LGKLVGYLMFHQLTLYFVVRYVVYISICTPDPFGLWLKVLGYCLWFSVFAIWTRLLLVPFLVGFGWILLFLAAFCIVPGSFMKFPYCYFVHEDWYLFADISLFNVTFDCIMQVEAPFEEKIWFSTFGQAYTTPSCVSFSCFWAA